MSTEQSGEIKSKGVNITDTSDITGKVFDPITLEEFEHCPYCGSSKFMMRELGKLLKKKGFISEKLDVGISEIGGTVTDPNAPVPLIPGSIRPGDYALRDICRGCGREVTSKITRKPVQLSIAGPGGSGGFDNLFKNMKR